MIDHRLSRRLFLLTVTLALAVPVLIDFAFCRSSSSRRPSVPLQIGKWQGKDLRLSADVRKNYDPLDVKLTWRKYKSPGRPPVESLIQQASNFENLHDIYACLVFAGARPKRLGVVRVGGDVVQPAPLFQYELNKRSYYALFCYQSKAGAAIFPPGDIWEQCHLTLVRRLPCRLVEVTTQVERDPQAAVARLTEVASAICDLPL